MPTIFSVGEKSDKAFDASLRGSLSAESRKDAEIPICEVSCAGGLISASPLVSGGLLNDRANDARTQLNGYLEDAMQTLYHNVFANDNSRTVGSIYDIAEVVYGAAFKSTLFNEGGDGFPLIRIRDLSTFKPQCYTTEENPKRTIINPGDVVAGMDAEFRPTFWLGDRALLNQRVCYFKPPENSCITPSYLLCALKPLLAFIQNYATGTTVAHLGKTDLEALDVPMPDEERLSQFTMNAEPMRLMIVSNAQENRRLEALRDSLLPRLMSGEIDVSKVDLTQLNSHLSGRRVPC